MHFNRSPVQAMDLKSNRSGLWRYMVAELVVGWEDYVADNQIMSRDMMKLQLSQHFRRATKFSVALHVAYGLYSLYKIDKACDVIFYGFKIV